jgi:hypothetical protein
MRAFCVAIRWICGVGVLAFALLLAACGRGDRTGGDSGGNPPPPVRTDVNNHIKRDFSSQCGTCQRPIAPHPPVPTR